jgi:hypothetical protein
MAAFSMPGTNFLQGFEQVLTKTELLTIKANANRPVASIRNRTVLEKRRSKGNRICP